MQDMLAKYMSNEGDPKTGDDDEKYMHISNEDIENMLQEIDKESNDRKPMQIDHHTIDYKIAVGDTDYIKRLFYSGTINDPNYGFNGARMIAKAAWWGHYDIAAMLLNMGAKHENTQALWWSDSRGYYHIEKLLLLSEFGGEIASNIVDKISKFRKQKAFCQRILSLVGINTSNNNNSNNNDTQWLDKLVDYVCKVLTQKQSFSDDFLMLSYYYTLNKCSNENINVFDSKLWQTLMNTCNEIMQTTNKRDWYFLHKYIVTSGLWLEKKSSSTATTRTNNNEQKETEAKKIESWSNVANKNTLVSYKIEDLLFDELVSKSKTELTKASKQLQQVSKKYAKEWKDLCAFGGKNWDNKYAKRILSRVYTRQDEIRNGIKSDFEKKNLLDQISPDYNPLVFYDVEQYLPKLLSIAHMVDNEFHESIVEIFGIDLITKSNSKLGISGYKRGPVKLIDRCKAKVTNDYKDMNFPTSAHLLDMNRCLIEFENVSSMLQCLNMFVDKVESKNGGNIVSIARIKNQFNFFNNQNPEYCDIKLNLIISSKATNFQIIGELQLMFQEMSNFKNVSHLFYKFSVLQLNLYETKSFWIDFA